MGFTDMKASNISLLAKQDWSIISNPDRLVLRILKARYFPNSTLLDSKLGYNPKYACRNIWSARSTLAQGCRWRIEDGIKVRVMGEPWLRRDGKAWMQSPHSQEIHDMVMNNLIHFGERMLDKVKTQSLFQPSTTREMIFIWLLPTNGKDRVVLIHEEVMCIQ
ncbi:hypothetical protein QL285_028361 [Trifolium repens]|nr:hypothetical protein QL285_028361 [Trifolium repens]